MQLIKRKKISGKEVAERIGKSESTVTSYVNGTNPTLDSLIKLSEIFEVDINTLILVDLSVQDHKINEPEISYSRINLTEQMNELRRQIEEIKRELDDLKRKYDTSSS